MTRTSRISFCDEGEVQEYQTASAINDDVKLKQGVSKVRIKHSLTDLARKFKSRTANELGPWSKPVAHSRKTNNSPIPSGGILQPHQKPALARINNKDATVRKIRSEEDLPLEIPEENIKTLLTLGFMSSLAFNVNESDEESLTESEIDHIIEIDRKVEKLANLRTRPRPVNSRSGLHFSKIPVKVQNIQKKKRKEQPTVEVLADLKEQFLSLRFHSFDTESLKLK